jgi:hypothetical protein
MPEAIGSELMKNAFALALMLVIGSAASMSALAAPQKVESASNQTVGQSMRHRNDRMRAESTCMRQANEMMYGAGLVQRRNFIRDCMMERGFR